MRASAQHLPELAEKAEMKGLHKESREYLEVGRFEPTLEASERLPKKHKFGASIGDIIPFDVPKQVFSIAR